MNQQDYEKVVERWRNAYGRPNSKFFDKLVGLAWMQSHAYGYNEVLSTLDDLCSRFEEELNLLKNQER